MFGSLAWYPAASLLWLQAFLLFADARGAVLFLCVGTGQVRQNHGGVGLCSASAAAHLLQVTNYLV